jgi:hypothetical protein
MASFLVRAGRLPATSVDRFVDVSGTHRADINALARAGITRGCNPPINDRFCPGRPITRAEMASLLARAVALPIGSGTTRFGDVEDGSTHAAAIEAIARAGITTGCGSSERFCPDRAVTRAQMAAFLVRGFGVAGTAPRTGPTEPPSGGGRRFGVATPSNAWNNAELQQVADLTGHRPSLVLHYLGFPEELHPQQLANVAAWGATPFLTWEPFDWRAGSVEQPSYALRNIADGRFDAYLTRTARTLAAFDGPVLLRFAHEMNGHWYPWSEQVNGNRRGDYVAAWRHVHDLFRQHGVDNVQWVWSPNVEFPGSQPLAELFPGPAYVDVVALDGYNWGSDAPSGWQSPGQVFDPTLTVVRRLAPGTPLMIGETASSERGGDKAAWNAALFDWLGRQPDVEALVWFHLDKEADWRIDSSPASATAFRQGLRRWLGS